MPAFVAFVASWSGTLSLFHPLEGSFGTASMAYTTRGSSGMKVLGESGAVLRLRPEGYRSFRTSRSSLLSLDSGARASTKRKIVWTPCLKRTEMWASSSSWRC